MKTLNGQASARDLKIGLFMPCYIDMIYPKVGIATLELLERFGLNVEYPLNQTCCGQPMSNSGDQANAAAPERLFVDIFKEYDYIIGPAGSCVKQVRCHFDTMDQTDEVKHVREHTYELVEFLHDILGVESFPWAEFPHPVAIHNSCSSVRGLGIAKPSEIMGAPFNKTQALLSKVKGLVLVPLDRPDECWLWRHILCDRRSRVRPNGIRQNPRPTAPRGRICGFAGHVLPDPPVGYSAPGRNRSQVSPRRSGFERRAILMNGSFQ
jgi:L-lactate dehydrogenase complex protein LldE